MLAADLDILRRALDHAASHGRLPADALSSIEILGTPPTLGVRDRLRDAQADQILVRLGAMSPATLAQRHNLPPK
jgi:hypothetical protein